MRRSWAVVRRIELELGQEVLRLRRPRDGGEVRRTSRWWGYERWLREEDVRRRIERRRRVLGRAEADLSSSLSVTSSEVLR